MAVLPAVCEFSDSGKVDSGLTFSVPGISSLLSWVLSYQRSRYSVEPCEWTPWLPGSGAEGENLGFGVGEI